MYIAVIINNVDNALGPNNRLCIWTQGCLKNCKNCMSPEFRTFNSNKNIDIIKMVLNELKITEYNISYTNSRIHDDTRYSLNCDKIKKELGWDVTFNFDDAFKFTVNWFKENYNWIIEILNKCDITQKAR